MPKKQFGMATYRNGKLYFDAPGWALIKAASKRQRKSPQTVVTAALMRFIRNEKKSKENKESVERRWVH